MKFSRLLIWKEAGIIKGVLIRAVTILNFLFPEIPKTESQNLKAYKKTHRIFDSSIEDPTVKIFWDIEKNLYPLTLYKVTMKEQSGIKRPK